MDNDIVYLLFLITGYNLESSDKLYKLYCRDEVYKVFKKLRSKDLFILLNSYRFLDIIYYTGDFEKSLQSIMENI